MNRSPERTWPRAACSVGGSSGVDAAQEERREDVGAGVEDERDRRGQGLDEHAARGRPRDVRERARPVDERLALDVALPGHDRDEQRRVSDPEDDCEGADEELGHEQLLDREDVERVRDRHARDHECAPEVRADHLPAPAATAVDPGARVEREEQVREEAGRGQVAHLGSAGIEHQHGRERQSDQRDLIADQRDRVRGEEAPELAVLPQERGDGPHVRADAGSRTG